MYVSLICVLTYSCMHTWTAAKGQLAAVTFPLLLWGFQVLKSGHQAWQQALSLNEPSQ